MPTPSNTLPLATQAVQALLRGESLAADVNYEMFGEYCELILSLNLLAGIDPREAEKFWMEVNVEVPRLAVAVEGLHQEGLVQPKDLFPVMKDWYDHGAPQGVSPGWPSLAHAYRIMPGEMTVICGTPSSGKSRFVTAMLVNIAKAEGWKFLLFSPEMSPPQRHLELALTQFVGKPFRRGMAGRMSWADAEEGLQWLQQHFTWLWPRTQPATIPYLLHMARQQALVSEVQAVVIDPWNRVAHQRHDKQLETDYIGGALSQLAASAQTYGYHQFVVAHPTKVEKANGQFPVITPNQIAGSSHWWNMPENILSVHRDISNDQDHTVQIHIQKIRWDENGHMGRMIELYYHPDTARYSEVYTPYATNGSRRSA